MPHPTLAALLHAADSGGMEGVRGLVEAHLATVSTFDRAQEIKATANEIYGKVIGRGNAANLSTIVGVLRRMAAGE